MSNRLRELRIAAGIGSASELARRVGIDRKVVWQIETHKQPLDEHKAARFAEVVGVRPGDLFSPPAAVAPEIAEAAALADALLDQAPEALADWLAVGRRYRALAAAARDDARNTPPCAIVVTATPVPFGRSPIASSPSPAPCSSPAHPSTRHTLQSSSTATPLPLAEGWGVPSLLFWFATRGCLTVLNFRRGN